MTIVKSDVINMTTIGVMQLSRGRANNFKSYNYIDFTIYEFFFFFGNLSYFFILSVENIIWSLHKVKTRISLLYININLTTK